MDLIRDVDAACGMTFVMEYPGGNLGSVSGGTHFHTGHTFLSSMPESRPRCSARKHRR